MMSPTSIGFVFLLGILHVCSGKTVIIILLDIISFYFGVYKLNFEKKVKVEKNPNSSLIY